MSGRDAGFQLPEFTLTFEENVREVRACQSSVESWQPTPSAGRGVNRVADLDFEWTSGMLMSLFALATDSGALPATGDM